MATLTNTQQTSSASKPIRLAIAGLGKRGHSMVKTMTDLNPDAELAVIVDPDTQKIQKQIDNGEIRYAPNVARYQNIDQMLQAGPDIDAIIIGTHCALHTPIAIQVAKLNLPLYLEKPVCINWDQYNQLDKAYATRHDNVLVSFPLRTTPLLQAVHAYIQDGRLGTINQIQAINNVSYGNVYVDTWYIDYEKTGGLWLQKATHDLDYMHYLADATPMQITAMHSRNVWKDPILHQDAGTAIVQYDKGFHATYSQNFITRRGAGKRGATITGENGTITFDWSTDSFSFWAHNQHREETVCIKTDSGHGGGDQILAQNFLDLILKRNPSQATLRDGLISAATCLAAREAANKNIVLDIPRPFGETSPQMIDRVIEPLT